MSDDCVCGHVLDEHENRGSRMFQKCTVEGCGCLDFEPLENDDDESD